MTVDTSKIKNSLVDFLSKPIDSTTNSQLQSLINYTYKDKFLNVNYLIEHLPKNPDGIFCSSVLKQIRDYLSNPNIDKLLIKALNCKGITIKEYLANTADFFNSKQGNSDIPLKIRKIYNSKILEIGGLNLTDYLEYDPNIDTIYDHIAGDAK